MFEFRSCFLCAVLYMFSDVYLAIYYLTLRRTILYFVVMTAVQNCCGINGDGKICNIELGNN
jgi:hypothetical protein